MPFFNEDEVMPRELFPGTTIRPMWGEKMMMVIIETAEGAVVPTHSHPHEQMGRVLSGVMELTIGAEVRTLRVGDHYVIPGGVPHLTVAIDGPIKSLDIFSPPREAYMGDNPTVPGQ